MVMFNVYYIAQHDIDSLHHPKYDFDWIANQTVQSWHIFSLRSPIVFYTVLWICPQTHTYTTVQEYENKNQNEKKNNKNQM